MPEAPGVARRIPLKAWHWILLLLVLIFLADWLLQRPDSRARSLNEAIEAKASEHLKRYPYAFRVLRMEGETAVMATPRNAAVPALRFIAVIHPEINVHDRNDSAFIDAERALAAAQSEARDIVQAQPGVTSVRWELDRHWLAAHGIEVPVP
jgi:hypothetical protein